MIMSYSDLRDLFGTIGTITIENLQCQSSDVLRRLAGRLEALQDNIQSEQQRRAVKELEARS